MRSVSASELVSALEDSARELSQAELSELLSAAIRLYVARSAHPYGDEALAGLTVTPPEACTVATALLHAHSLSPFEFSVWFSTSGR